MTRRKAEEWVWECPSCGEKVITGVLARQVICPKRHPIRKGGKPVMVDMKLIGERRQ